MATSTVPALEKFPGVVKLRSALRVKLPEDPFAAKLARAFAPVWSMIGDFVVSTPDRVMCTSLVMTGGTYNLTGTGQLKFNNGGFSNDIARDSVATGIAKAVSLQGMSGKISAVVEATNSTEGKPREIEEPPVEKHDLAYGLKCVRAFYGLKDPEEGDAEIIVTRNKNVNSKGLSQTTKTPRLMMFQTVRPWGPSKGKPE